MNCNAITVIDENVWGWGAANIGDPEDDEVVVKVDFSSLCGTDKDIVDGSLCYYQTGEAQYPIITGHEWCGHTEDGPVTGLCILPGRVRTEVGVVNRNGAHADYIIMPKSCLVPIPEISPKYALVEPTAVVLHGLSRINLHDFKKILIIGYGAIGRICGDILRSLDLAYVVYDPKYPDLAEIGIPEVKSDEKHPLYDRWQSIYECDLVIECSGNEDSLTGAVGKGRCTVLGFGFDYKQTLGELVSSEVTFVGSLGSTKRDFIRAIEMMPKITSVDFDMMKIEDFGKALTHDKKVVFAHGV